MKKITVTAALALFAATASAQAPSRPIELGIDAAVDIRLGDDANTEISVPAPTFRIGFPISPRVSLEPKFGIRIRTDDDNTATTYRGELGLLYHLGSDRYPGAFQRAGIYVRPFVGISDTNPGNSDASGLIGIGLGYKMPIISRLSSRFEANFQHVFGDDDANVIGLLAGLSFFTR
ncbi:MAG TPA: outer membrane beta-barrel protein [Gemmatimonadaceae bacterium]